MEASAYASFILQLVVLHMQLQLVSGIFVGVSSLITVHRSHWTGGY